MNLAEVASFFSGHGLPLRWTSEGTRGRRTAAPSTPLDLTVDVAVVIPDVHLGIGLGDVFQEHDISRTTRLERFLDVLAALRDALPAERFAAVQLGDYFDVMRSTGPAMAAASFVDRLALVRAAYPGVAARSSALPLLHCIGNHDFELYAHRAELEELGISAHLARALGPGVLAFHGNDLVSLRDVELDVGYQTWLLSLVQSVASMPLLGPVDEILQRYFDASLEDPILSAPASTSLPWPPPPAGLSFPAGWTAPWTVRDAAEQLGEPLLDWERALGRELQLAIVGHSHRPGISWVEVDFERRIPLVDVGSWTFGRTDFAVLCAEGIALAELV